MYLAGHAPTRAVKDRQVGTRLIQVALLLLLA